MAWDVKEQEFRAMLKLPANERYGYLVERDGMRVAVFQTPDDHGVGVGVERLKRDLSDELSQFEL